MRKLSKLEAILWSIAFPGFPQLLVGAYIKGIFFMLLEFCINVQSQFNEAIRFSFLGEMDNAVKVINYEWLMFYPCIYMYVMWDSYCISEGDVGKYDFLPFVFGAYFLTVGTMYGSKANFLGIYPGPVFFPMIILPLGLFVGFILKKVFVNFQER
ncbi:hypothetical protein OEV98_01840 [Caldibacillus lycopersici]|uniref:Uncharacterized protein n=1 Tax=Perspicuibacillus lycopersici TaxID=1325689 RepID=A0AAE3IRF1_9BACI|nr:hypothetical protein [Perspicuibacillus lycopersici]MCU9612303.1 hypothetical protein [Perspicuibacillus lycopersici]